MPLKAAEHWRKLGLVYAPSGEKTWARSYATIPTAHVVGEDIIRVFFAALDEQRFGRIGYVDLDADSPTRIISESREPVLDLGPAGAFDDSGVNPSCIVDVNGRKFLYYIGWQRAERVPYLLFAGLAVSTDGVHFERASSCPVLDRTPEEPFLRSATSVLCEEGIFKAWYVSALEWIVVRDVPYPRYVIRYATSPDGIVWTSNNAICIDFQNEDEFGFGRPWVVKENDVYAMWFSVRSKSAPYRLGYAESADGIHWSRRDDLVGLERSPSGWDSEMICYSCVITVKGRKYMFYNGNRHGSTGFGCAVSA
jgi:hypothetical protein